LTPILVRPLRLLVIQCLRPHHEHAPRHMNLAPLQLPCLYNKRRLHWKNNHSPL
jgi:hypothetical protein